MSGYISDAYLTRKLCTVYSTVDTTQSKLKYHVSSQISANLDNEI